MPREIVILKAGSAIDLKWPAFVVDSKEVLAIDRQEAGEHDFILACQPSDQWFDFRSDDPAFWLPKVPDTATSDDPCGRRRERRRIHV